jgi:hypothetical protein
MQNKTHSSRARVGAVALAAITVAGLGIGSAVAGGKGETKKENWSQVDRNTNGSPVAALRDGPSAAQIHSSGQLTAPPFGKGSLGLTVDTGEQASFGDQVDFYGDNVLDLTAVGFYEFNTGENGTSNNASIKLEINPNVTGPTDGYTTMVWVPADNPYVDQWSPYLDATQSGTWYFTGSEGATITCSQGSPCTFDDAKTRLAAHSNGSPATIYTVAVSKGRDSAWSGAVDGVKQKGAK